MKPMLRPVQIKLIVSTLTLMMMMMMMKMRMTNLTPTFLAKQGCVGPKMPKMQPFNSDSKAEAGLRTYPVPSQGRCGQTRRGARRCGRRASPSRPSPCPSLLTLPVQLPFLRAVEGWRSYYAIGILGQQLDGQTQETAVCTNRRNRKAWLLLRRARPQSNRRERSF